MDGFQDFEELARRARQEPAPRVDVTHRVLATIAASPHAVQPAGAPRIDTRPMLLCAAGALLAASIVVLLASSSWVALNDPFSDLLTGLSVLNP
jgi:hypothetical protein